MVPPPQPPSACCLDLVPHHAAEFVVSEPIGLSAEAPAHLSDWTVCCSCGLLSQPLHVPKDLMARRPVGIEQEHRIGLLPSIVTGARPSPPLDRDVDAVEVIAEGRGVIHITPPPVAVFPGRKVLEALGPCERLLAD